LEANSPRHSFCTYRIKLTGDPAGVADEMGTSIAKIEKHYRIGPTEINAANGQRDGSPSYRSSWQHCRIATVHAAVPEAYTVNKVAAL